TLALPSRARDDQQPPSARAPGPFAGVKARTPGAAVPPSLPQRLSSEPIDVLGPRIPALSATDLPPTAGPEAPPLSSRRGRGTWRVLLSLLALAVVGAGGWVVYARMARRSLV